MAEKIFIADKPTLDGVSEKVTDIQDKITNRGTTLLASGYRLNNSTGFDIGSGFIPISPVSSRSRLPSAAQAYPARLSVSGKGKIISARFDGDVVVEIDGSTIIYIPTRSNGQLFIPFSSSAKIYASAESIIEKVLYELYSI